MNLSPSSSTSSVVAAVSSASVSKSRTFNARFRVKEEKPSNDLTNREDDQRKLVEEEEQRFSQCLDNGYVGSTSRTTVTSQGEVFSHMQISACFSKPEVDAVSRETSLVCVARRMPPTDRTPSNIQVEQFSTRLDLRGNLLAIDTSGVSSTYSQYLNKSLIGRSLLELCHPLDMLKVKGHLEEALRTRTYTNSPVYRLMVAQDRYVCVQTKSKLFATSEEEYVMATHSIIRDSESTTNITVVLPVQTNVGNSSPARLPAIEAAGPSRVVSSATSSNDTAVTTTYDYLSLSPSTNDVECSDLLQDCLGLSEILPSNSWSDYESTQPESEPSKSEEVKPRINLSAGMTSSSAGITVSSAQQSDTNTTSSASSTTVNTSSSPRTSNQFGGQVGQQQQSHSSPKTSTGSNESPTDSATHKLRNLLTQGSSDEDPNSNSQSSHDILRDLLNNEDTEDFQGIVSGAAAAVSASFASGGNVVFSFDTTTTMTSSAPSSSSSKPLTTASQITTDTSSSTNLTNSGNKTNNQNNNSGNDMLRKLLNDDDQCKNYRKSSQPQDILQQLLKDNSDTTQGSPSHNSSYPSTPVSTLPTSLSELMSPQSAGPSSLARFSNPSSNKRKSVDESGSLHGSQPPTPQAIDSYKRPATTVSQQPKSQQLAGQNPMLASMLAQTPKTLPVAPITIPTSIVSQVPQERLPKNLEKKLVHTPAGQDGLVLVASQGSLGGIVSPGQFMLPNQAGQTVMRANLANLPPNIQALGPVSQHRFQVQTQMDQNNQQQQGFLNKMLVDGNSMSPRIGPSSQPMFPTTSGQQHQQQSVHQIQQHLRSGGMIQFPDDQQSDPMLSDILDHFLQQEMDVTSVVSHPSVSAPQVSNHLHQSNQSQASDDMLLKILDEVLEPSNPAVATPSTPGSSVTPSTPTNDMNEKLRISEIQRQLMSCEASSQQQRQAFAGPFVNFSSHQGPPPAYSSQVMSGVRGRLPQVMQHRPQQYIPTGMSPTNMPQQPMSPGFTGNMASGQPRGIKGQTRAQLQNQQKRQMLQQNQQPMGMLGNPGDQSVHMLPDNLNEMLNKTIAPNVSLPLKPRFPGNHGGNSPIPQSMNPSQLSPNQRQQISAPFSPHGQSYPSHSPSGQPPVTTNFPPSNTMSPHPHSGYSNVSSPLPGPNSPAGMMQSMSSPQPNYAASPTPGHHQNWTSGPRPQGNRIQAANPMLNAQLGGPGQPAVPASGQIRFTNRPSVPPTARGMGSPGPRNSPQFPQSPGQFQQQAPQPGGPNARLIQLNPQTQPLIQGSQVSRTRGASPRIMASNESPFSSSFTSSSGTPVQIEARSPGQFMASQGISSEVRQKVQAIVGARSQHHLQQQSQAHQMMMSSSPSMSVSSIQSSSLSMASNSFTQADLDAMDLGLSLELEPSGLSFGSAGDSLSMHTSFEEFTGNMTNSSSSTTCINNTPSGSSPAAQQHLLRSQSLNSPRMVGIVLCSL